MNEESIYLSCSQKKTKERRERIWGEMSEFALIFCDFAPDAFYGFDLSMIYQIHQFAWRLVIFRSGWRPSADSFVNKEMIV
jgi:hypothetical protein